MKKLNVSAVCFTVSIILLLGFIIATLIDYSHYNSTLNSAPFSLWIVVNAICYVVPSAVVFVVGLIIRNMAKKRNVESGINCEAPNTED